jgi:Tol biopolymer transport system component
VPLQLGTRLGPYEIVSALGAGGMGEVYRARDTKLNRDVALKVLPDLVATDPERLARFHREAQVLASLNHPHIAGIYGFEDSSGTHALAMELVDGPTLADRIARGPVPLPEALPIARQIAEAVEAAHALGIIHRDLKPANIKVRDDGTVKVLDFGLAKLADPGGAGAHIGADANLTASPTRTSPAMMTSAGVILGTAAYMSPEQARGKPVDTRTDIWAFGCVLFEMLSGRRAFAGQTVTDALAAIIEREPAWSLLPVSTPNDVLRLLRRCLAKDPKRRLHDIADARLELYDALTEPIRDEATVDSSRSARERIGWALALIATAIAAAATAWVAAQRTRSAVTGGPAADATLERLTYDSGVTRMPALSPDGRLLAYASDRAGNGDLDIWVQQVSGSTPLRLTDDPADDSTPDFSPDANQVVFRSERNGGGIYVVPAFGGPARLIAQDGRRPRFSPDGSRIAYWSGQFRGSEVGYASSVYVVALSGGAPVRVLPDFEVANHPVWAPDGRSLLVAGRRERTSQQSEGFDWWLTPLDGRPPVKTTVFETPLLRGAGVAPSRWTSSGVLFPFNDDLWRVMLSSAGRLSAPPRRLTLGVGPYVDPATGPSGEVVFARLVTQRAVERASLTNPTETAMRLYADTGSSTWRASGTNDGSIIVFEREVGAAREIWIKNTRSGRQELIVRVPTRGPVNATVSSDGARIAYTQDSNVTGGSDRTGYVIEMSGGVPRKVCDACELHGFLADNQRVLVKLTDGHAIRVVDIRTGAARDLVVAENGGRLDRPHASPDDRWVAFRRARGTAGKTVVVRLTSDRPVPADSVEAIDEPTTTGRPGGWSLDSHVVYLLLDADGFRCVWGQRIDPETGTLVGKPFAARHFHTTNGMSTSFGNAITAGGFLYEAADATANLWKLTAPASTPEN